MRTIPLLIASLLLVPTLFGATLSRDNLSLSVNDKGISILKSGETLVDLQTIRFNYLEPISWTTAYRSDDRIEIAMEYPSAVDYRKLPDDDEPRSVTLTISMHANGFRFHAKPDWGRQTTIEFAHTGDRFFGLSSPLQPDNRHSPDLTGGIIDVDVASEGETIAENYASAFSAFYISSHGYGAFFDTFARGRYDFALNGRNRIHHDTGELDWYLFFGDDGAEIHKGYFDLIGAPKSVPLWALGPVGWRDQNNGGATEILDDIAKMSELEIPLTSWFVDRPYSDGNHAWSKMNFNENFAKPEEWIGKIREDYGLEFMTWTATSTFGDARFEKHLDGEFTYIDLSHPESVAAYQNELKQKQYRYGVKGHKIDRADEKFPLYENWHDTSVGISERRNRYVYLFSKIHDEALRAAWGEDQVSFARAAIHRTQPYLTAIWGGDPRQSWEGLQGNYANAARASFMGFPVWGTDVGGYLGEGRIPENLYIRWMQAGSMSGLFEIKLDGSGGDGEDRMPWRYGKALQDAFRSICEDRMRFLPYLYSLANTSAQKGPIMQPLAYRHLDDPNTYDIWDQFYVGEGILVAPVMTRDTKRSIYLPKGNWRNFDDPTQQFDGEQTIEFPAPLETLPRFIRDNSVFVTGHIYAGNDRRWNGDKPQRISIHVYPGATGESARFDYIDALANDAAIPIAVEHTDSGIDVHAPPIACDSAIRIRSDNAPKKILLNGEALSEFTYEGEFIEVLLPARSEIRLSIE